MRKLASVQEIREIRPIANADRIEEALVEGWHVVVEKGMFKEGERVVFCEVDSILPKDNPNFSFLEGKPIKTKKLKGVYSQGCVFPMDVLPDGTYEVGQDVTGLLGVRKYEPDVLNREIGIKVKKLPEGFTYFPSWIPKTDETRVQSLQNYLTRYRGVWCMATEKLDGSSLTAFLDENDELHVCSRNKEITDKSHWMYQTAIEEGFKEKLKRLGPDSVVQGEIVGVGIQGNKYKLKDRKIYAYNYRYMNEYPKMEVYALQELEDAGFRVVPVVIPSFRLYDDIDELVMLAEGKSKLNPHTEREGIVIRPLGRIDVPDADGNFVDSRFSFKVINPKFLVKYGG